MNTAKVQPETTTAQQGDAFISPRAKWLLLIGFVIAIAGVPMWHVISDVAAHSVGQRVSAVPTAVRIVPDAMDAFAQSRPTSGWLDHITSINMDLQQQLRAYEQDVRESSPLATWLRPRWQSLAVQWLGEGNANAIVGGDGYLYYSPDLAWITARDFMSPKQTRGQRSTQPPQAAILDFKSQLDRRGIQLVLLPVPVKPCIHPQGLIGGRPVAEPIQNEGFAAFTRWLTERDIAYLDPAPVLLAAEQAGRPQYLKTDTHWRPQAVRATADSLAAFLNRSVKLDPVAPLEFAVQQRMVTHLGDIADQMLDLLASQSLFAPETVTIERVLAKETGESWQPDPHADILFLGDSFSNIYSNGAMQWGESAGLVEQLSRAMRRPIDAIVLNDGGANGTRQALAQRLTENADALKHVRVVVWQFAVRELVTKRWEVIPLPSRQTVDASP